MYKRLFDIAVAGAALVAAAPIMLAVSVVIKLTSSGPVFYRGVRAGLGGRPFRILKFRTMVRDAERIGGPSTALADCRLTVVGAFLRKYKLDEIPQLISVIKGDMSIVGPRPQVLEYTSAYTSADLEILSVRPGITDYASIEFIHLDALLGEEDVDRKYRTEIEPRKNALRLRYVREKSFWVDLKILALTLRRFVQIPKLWNTPR